MPPWNFIFEYLKGGTLRLNSGQLFLFPPQVFSPSVYVDVALQKQLEELLNSCYYIPSKEEASKVEVSLPNDYD